MPFLTTSFTMNPSVLCVGWGNFLNKQKIDGRKVYFKNAHTHTNKIKLYYKIKINVLFEHDL